MAIGPWGEAADVIVALIPIAFLLILVLKKNPSPATTALPLSAALLWFLRFAYFQSDPNLVNAALVDGITAALTPTAIAFGAITMFQTMEYTKSLPWLVNWMKSVSHGNPVAEIMIIGLCFTFILEGAAGFGIPAALGTPILVSLGYDPVKIGCTALIMNSIQNCFGAVGVGLFFGFRGLEDENGDPVGNDVILEIGFKAGILISILALIVPPMGLRVCVPWHYIKKSWLFIYLSIVSIIVPMVAISVFSYNLPTLLGGLVGLLITMFLAQKKIGLPEDDRLRKKLNGDSAADALDDPVGYSTLGQGESLVVGKSISFDRSDPLFKGATGGYYEGVAKTLATGSDELSDTDYDMSVKSTLLNLFPLWGSVIILVIIRTQDIGVYDELQRVDPSLQFDIGTFATFRLGPTLRVSLLSIFGVDEAEFDFPVLSTPWFLPFVFVSLIQYIIFRKEIDDPNVRWYSAMANAAGRMKKPAMAFAGATALSQLLVAGGELSPAFAIGDTVARAFKAGWVAISPLVGGLGAFFSGSLTISNLTFGSVQQYAAQALEVSETSMLALQHAGGCAGNMIAIGNIILVKAVLGGPVAHVPIGTFVRINIIPFLISVALLAACGFVLVFAI